MKYAVYRKDKSYLFDIEAASEKEALWKAKSQSPDAEIVIQIVPGGDLGVNGL